MSLDLPADSIGSPWASGMLEGNDPNDPTHYHYFAYKRPHGDTWFVGHRRRPGRSLAYGAYVHYIKTSVRDESLPAMDDRVVAALTYAGYVELYRKELQFWADYTSRLGPLITEWANDVHPDVPRHLLPPHPDGVELAALTYAHSKVAERDGRGG